MEAVIFAKPPRPGEVKSRLAEAIGPQAAAGFAEAALIDTIERLNRVPGLELVLSTSRVDEGWPTVAQALSQRLQPAGDLGKKMSDAIDRALQSADKVTLWGADAPHFEPGCAEGIRLALDEVDTVLCPSEDGGFYALGSRVSLDGLLEGLPWGTSEALASTRNALGNAGLSVRLLYPNFDIDRVDDLHKLEVLVAKNPGRVPAVERWISQWRDEAHLGLGCPK